MNGSRPKVTIVGALPPPTGGVTVFLRRLKDLLQSDFSITLLDLRKVDGKASHFKRHIISPFYNRLLSILWLQYQLICQRHDVVHLHFSSVRGLFVAAVLVSRSQAVMLTLHHGVTNLSTASERLLRCVAPLLRRKISTIHALNADQRAFYQSVMGFGDTAVFQCPTHIAPNRHERPLAEETKDLLSRMTPYVLTSGVGNRLNRADLVLDYWATRQEDGMHLVVSVYGDSDPDYVAELQRKADAIATAVLVGPVPENDFNVLLKTATVYLRPAEVDSFGIAVADALAFGTPVLASNACQRAEEVCFFDRYRPREMSSKLETLILANPKKGGLPFRMDRSEEYRRRYWYLTHVE